MLKKRMRSEKGQVLVFSILLLPLVLGILALLVEVGNLYVHYWNLQNAADTAVLTLDASKAKEVADKNNTVKPKRYVNVTVDVDLFKIETSTYSDENNFYVRLKKTVPSFFEKVFDKKGIPLTAYAAASKDPPKLINFTTDPKSLDWKP